MLKNKHLVTLPKKPEESHNLGNTRASSDPNQAAEGLQSGVDLAQSRVEVAHTNPSAGSGGNPAPAPAQSSKPSQKNTSK